MKRTFPIIFVLLAFSLCAFGQSNRKIEQELVRHIKNIEKWSEYGGGYDPARSEKLSRENAIFQKKLLKYTKRASTLKYKFAELDKYLSMAASEDGKLRVFSWDTQSGGSMHFYETVYQYQGKNGKVYSKPDALDEGDPGSFAHEIFTLNTKTENIYLVYSTSILSNANSAQWITLFKIGKNFLTDNVKLVKTDEGIENYLGMEYDFFSVADREERPIKLIRYDKASKSIKIPVVVPDEKFVYGKVTDDFITYKFDGKYFVKTK